MICHNVLLYLTIIARDKNKMLVLTPFWTMIGHIRGLISIAALKLGIHLTPSPAQMLGIFLTQCVSCPVVFSCCECCPLLLGVLVQLTEKPSTWTQKEEKKAFCGKVKELVILEPVRGTQAAPFGLTPWPCGGSCFGALPRLLGVVQCEVIWHVCMKGTSK